MKLVTTSPPVPTLLYLKNCHLHKSHSVWIRFKLVFLQFFAVTDAQVHWRLAQHSCRHIKVSPWSHLTICRAVFHTVRLEGGGELKDWCMTACHSAFTLTSVMSLCISVTRVLHHWPAPTNQPSWLLDSLPTSPRSALSPLLWLFLPLSPHLLSLPACLHLVFHSSGAPHLHCGCQSAGRREEWRWRSV